MSGQGYFYRGVTSGGLYQFADYLVDSAGHPVVGGQYSTATWNGETVVIANHDGSMQRSTAGPSILVPSSQEGVGNIALPTTWTSPWEEHVPVVNPGPLPIELPGGLPGELG
jgi:hypothetical protein